MYNYNNKMIHLPIYSKGETDNVNHFKRRASFSNIAQKIPQIPFILLSFALLNIT